MPKIEVEESEFLASQQLTQTVAKMLQNPKARRLVQEATKIVRPDAVIPEIDAAAPVMEAVSNLQKQLDEERAERKKDRDERADAESTGALKNKWEAGQSYARDNGYTADGLKALEDYMQAEGIFSHKIGIAAFEREHPPAQVIQPTGLTAWDYIQPEKGAESDFMKKMLESHGEDDGALRQEINSVLSETRTRR